MRNNRGMVASKASQAIRSLIVPFGCIVVLLCSINGSVSAQVNDTLSGTVLSAEDGTQIVGASIWVQGTRRRVVTNSEGRYVLKLAHGLSSKLQVTAMGYRPDTMSVTLIGNQHRDVRLTPTPVVAAPITVTATDSRREAERIVREAIAAKDRWQSKLQTYQFQVYARMTLQTLRGADSNVLSVLESEADGYWSKEKGYGERIVARRQTANLPPEVNRVSLLKVIDMNYDRLDVDIYSLPGPIARDALHYYDYDLVGTRNVNGVDCYELSIEPTNGFVAGFVGTIWIGKAEYELEYVDLRLSDAVKVGPMSKTRIEESFALVNNQYYLPAELRFYVEAKLQIPIVPVFHLDHVSVMQNYSVNGVLPDSLFATKRHFVSPDADSIPAAVWGAVETVPLTAKEAAAYRKIDSVQHATVAPSKFRPLEFLSDVVINPNLLQYNRVEGLRLEGAYAFDQLGSWPLGLDAIAAYGFNDKRFGYDATLTQAIFWHAHQGFSASYSSEGTFSASRYDRLVNELSASVRIHDDRFRRGQAKSIAMNSLTSILYKGDFPDYYWAKGYDAFLTWDFAQAQSFEVRYRHEDESSMRDSLAAFSIFLPSKPFRINPPINDGRLASLSGTLLLEQNWDIYTLNTRLYAEYANHSLGSDFDYTKFDVLVAFAARVGAWGISTVYLDLGTIPTGRPGVQQLFIFETPRGFANRARAFLTMKEREYQGDKIFQLYLEQDFFDLPTRVLGLHFLDRFQLHWFGLMNIGSSELADSTARYTAVPVKVTTSSPFVEAGFGIGNIFNLVRVDFAWRITHRRTDVNNFAIKETFEFTF